MNKTKAIRIWSDRHNIPFAGALKINKAVEEAANVQTDWHNGDATEAKAEEACRKVCVLAAKLGYDTIWPGLYPVLVNGDEQVHMADWDDYATSIEDSGSIKIVSVDFDNDAEYVHIGNGVWHSIHTIPDPYDDDRVVHRLNADEIFDDLTRYIPGIKDIAHYAGWTFEIYEHELEEAGWTLAQVYEFFHIVCEHLKEQKPLHSTWEPQLVERTDAWGHKFHAWQLYGFELPGDLAEMGYEEQSHCTL